MGCDQVLNCSSVRAMGMPMVMAMPELLEASLAPVMPADPKLQSPDFNCKITAFRPWAPGISPAVETEISGIGSGIKVGEGEEKNKSQPEAGEEEEEKGIEALGGGHGVIGAGVLPPEPAPGSSALKAFPASVRVGAGVLLRRVMDISTPS